MSIRVIIAFMWENKVAKTNQEMLFGIAINHTNSFCKFNSINKHYLIYLFPHSLVMPIKYI